jgi:phosphoribosylamine-glycine ligase
MKILLCSWRGEGAWYVWLMRNAGHEVDWTVDHEDMASSMAGLIPPPRSKVNPGGYDLVVFDCTEMGDAADFAATQAPTIGDSTLADRLENDRIFGIEVMEQAGIRVPKWEAFNDPGKAIDWVNKNHKRCVLKPVGDAPSEMTYVGKNEEDLIRFIETRLPGSKVKEFILQEFVAGTETAAGGWFNGSEWVVVDHNIEEKKFMNGGLGPNTGCAGSVMWIPPKPTPLFQQGLGRVTKLLAEAGYRGPLDLNTIVTEGEAYGIEWTPRFGYESTCNFTRLLGTDFAEFLYGCATGSKPIVIPRNNFAATVRCSVPPYPTHDLKAKQMAHQPIRGLVEKDLERFFTFDVVANGEELMVCGEGNVGTPIGLSESLRGAFEEVMTKIKGLDIPDLQYRTDICECIEKKYNTLQTMGWLRQIG